MFKKRFLFIFLIFVISLVALSDLFKPGLPLTHDGRDHVARIANFYQNLSEGNIIPRWAGNLNWGYGHPILEFLYPLPSYFASLFHFFGFTLVDSVKLVFGVSFVLSAFAMYYFVKELVREEKASFFAGLLYIIAPYRFVDLYVRGAIGEHVAFIFPPLIFYFLLKLSKRYSGWYVIGGAMSIAGLNLSHNAISLMFMPLFGLFALFLFLRFKDKLRLGFQYACMLILGFGLSSFFWIPAFLEGKYTLRDIVTGGGEYIASFVKWSDFFFGQWSYGGTLDLSKQIGILHWVGVFGGMVAIYLLFRNKNKFWILYLGAIIIFWASLFLMTSGSNSIWESITILQKFQFPWRFLSLAVFLSALFGAITLNLFSDKYKKILLLIFTVILLVVNKDYWHANDFLVKQENFYNGIYDSTTDTGESSPVWSVRFMEKRPNSKAEIISGYGKIEEVERNFTERKYRINALGKIRILENTLYFPGWVVFVDGKPVDIEFQDQNYRGLVTFYIDKGEHDVEILYGETKVRMLSNIASAISLLAIIGIIIKYWFRKGYNKINKIL